MKSPQYSSLSGSSTNLSQAGTTWSPFREYKFNYLPAEILLDKMNIVSRGASIMGITALIEKGLILFG